MVDLVAEDAIFKVGQVVSVEGRAIKIRVDKTKNTSHLLYKGELLKNVTVGGYIKIIKWFTAIIGKIDGEFITEDKQFSKKWYGNNKERVNRILNVSLLGFFKGNKFERGIKEMPLIDNECFLLKNLEFEQVHNFVKTDDDPLTLGTLTLEKGQLIQFGVTGLFASHIGIFGNTGSGKSYTLAKLYHELFELYKNKSDFKDKASFFLIDFNGEYINSDQNQDVITDSTNKQTFCLSTRSQDGDKFPITQQMINDPEFWVVFLQATDKTQSPFLKRAIRGANITEEGLKSQLKSMLHEVISKKDKNLGVKILFELFSDIKQVVTDGQTADSIVNSLKQYLGFNGTTGSYYLLNTTPITYVDDPANCQMITDIKSDIDRLSLIDGKIARLQVKIILKFFDEIIKGHSNREHLSPVVKRLESRTRDLEKIVRIIDVDSPESASENLTIVSLKDVNTDMKKIMPLLLCKNLYLEKKKDTDLSKYLNIIIDEAHNILSEDSTRESEQWRDHRLETFEEIIKEGRKFGVFLTIASQRPADISATIISQLHNYFLHRLINNEDIRAVEKTISYLDRVSFEYLPILPTGTCIIAGLMANVPVVVDIGKIEPKKYEPNNKTMTLPWVGTGNSQTSHEGSFI